MEKELVRGEEEVLFFGLFYCQDHKNTNVLLKSQTSGKSVFQFFFCLIFFHRKAIQNASYQPKKKENKRLKDK